MAIIPTIARSSLAQALANEVGSAMRDLEPQDYMSAARKVQRAFRSYRSSKRPYKRARSKKSKLEKRVYTGVRNETWSVQQGFPTGPAFAFGLGELVLSDFSWPFATNSQSNNRHRENNIIHVKGIKLCRQFQYARVRGSGDVGPIEVHWALLQLKNDEDNTELTTELSSNFFRDNAEFTRSSSDFVTYTGTSQWNMKLNCQPINPNNKVNVLMHRKKVLCALDAQSEAADKNVWKIEGYHKVNKTFSFKDNDSGLPSKRIFEVFWCNTQTPFEFPTDPTAVQYIESDKTHTVYFSNDKICC